MAARKFPEENLRMLGIRVEIHREQRGWTRKELAGRLGISNESIHAVETARHSLSLEMLRQVAIALEVTYDDLLGSPVDGEDIEKDDVWESGRRAGVSDALHAIREIM